MLSDVSCPSRDACIAVGTSHAAGYSMFGEIWDGETWALQLIPTSTAAEMGVLSGVACVSKDACTAVGYIEEPSGSTLPLVEAWDGTAWTEQPAPVPNGSTSSVLSAVSSASKVACVAVGSSDVNPAGDYVTLAEVWDGTSWTVESTPNPAKASQLLGVSCSEASACIAVGSWQKPPPMGPRAGSRLLAEDWNGTVWAIEKTPPLASSAFGQLSGVSCPSGVACLAAGYSGLPGAAVPIVDIWDGSTWTAEATPGVAGAAATQLYDVSCPSASACTAVGAANFANRVQTLVEAGSGDMWASQPTPGPSVNSLSAISCVSGTSCTAVGYSYDRKDGSYVPLVEAE